MKHKFPHFLRKDAKTKKQIKIVELMDAFGDAQESFVKENLDKHLTNEELFNVVKDASIGYAFKTIDHLSTMLADKKEIPEFFRECFDLIQCYFDRISERASKQNET
jgi:hypothetical protein